MVLAELAAADPAPRGDAPWGTIASVCLHAGLAAVLVFSPAGSSAPPPGAVVTVDIVSLSEFAALAKPAVEPVPVALSTPQAAVPMAEPDASGRLTPKPPAAVTQSPTITATEFFSADILLDPGEAGIRRSLASFADRERIIQVCNLEAMEQIGRNVPEYVPDAVVGYAMSDLIVDGLTVIAAGGAFRSRRRWYEVAYTCTAAPGYEAVTAFAFKLGDEIPEDVWDAHNLNASDDDENE
jgi:hypothetical protein